MNVLVRLVMGVGTAVGYFFIADRDNEHAEPE
jgi:hypothetical protein